MVAYLNMFPILLSIGKISIFSFGIFLSLSFLLGIFLVWRLSRAWELDEEKVLDLTLLSLLGGLVVSRIYFAVEHLQFFLEHHLAILAINKYPGFSFWGGVFGGILTLFLLVGRKKDNFLQALDIASVGVTGGLILANFGCFLGGCNIGITSNLFFAVNMMGVLGKRFPVQTLEALLLILAINKIWSMATHFHQRGKIFSVSLIYIAAIKLLMEPLKQNHDEGVLFSVLLLILGAYTFYKVTKRKLLLDLKEAVLFLYKLPTDSKTRNYTLDRLKKYWYNRRVVISWNLRNFKKILRRFNVRLSYKNNKQY